MSEQQWNNRKHCFWLLAVACGFQWVMAYAIFGACSYGVLSASIPLGACKDVVPNVFELLVGPLAVIMAFLNGSNTAPPKE